MMLHGENRLYKAGLAAAMVLLLLVVSFTQRSLNRQRTQGDLGLRGSGDLGSNAPPVLAFTTVALGGFRGIIANILWMRASELQEQGKYFEMVQLADWITKLEPHFTQVWLVQAWNMAYNISVKFTDAADRWRWVQAGIALLRDQGIVYNPHEALVYRELGWFFQHKMGQNLDDAHVFYKRSWITNMTEVLNPGPIDFDTLISPKTEEDRRRAEKLRAVYKLDPNIMREVDQRYGPLEWKLPDAHAIYWAYVGLKMAKNERLIELRRMIYQAMHQAVLQGTIVQINTNLPPTFGPNLNLVDRTHAAYEEMIRDDETMRDAIRSAHKNFLRESVYLLYSHNRLAQAQRYFELTKQAYPQALPPGQDLPGFVLSHLSENVSTLTHNQTVTLLEGLLQQSFLNRAISQDDLAEGYQKMAADLYGLYAKRVGDQIDRLGLPPLKQIAQSVLDRMLDPATGVVPELRAQLREALNLPASPE